LTTTSKSLEKYREGFRESGFSEWQATPLEILFKILLPLVEEDKNADPEKLLGEVYEYCTKDSPPLYCHPSIISLQVWRLAYGLCETVKKELGENSQEYQICQKAWALTGKVRDKFCDIKYCQKWQKMFRETQNC